MDLMNTKKCPFCHEEISEDAILCKYCHNLLTDDDEEETVVFTPESESEDDERTRVFSAQTEVKPTVPPVRKPAPAPKYEDEYDDEEEYDDDYDDDDYDDDDDDYDDGAAKKTFITAAIVTFGVLLIVIIAIFAGYKIFGGNKDDSKAPALNSSMVLPESQADSSEPTSAAPADASIDETSSSDDTSADQPADSSAPDTSSEAPADSSSTAPADSSSAPDTSSETPADSSSTPDDSNVAQIVPEDNDKMVAEITEALKGYNDTGVAKYEFRATESSGSVKFYYFFMGDGKGYSVAYFTADGKIKIVG